MGENLSIELPPLENRPLVTFALFAYNQEKYIREAVQGALSQTYTPLEIIFSDDHSTDKTYEIIEELINNYDGPHKIIKNRNTKNQGLSNHIQYIHQLASSDIVVHAAGDDISYPNRVSTIIEKYRDLIFKESISLIGSNADLIDGSGNLIGQAIPEEIKSFKENSNNFDTRLPGGGYSYVVTKKLYCSFPSVDPEIIAEDELLTLRSRIMGGFQFTNEKLLKYRITPNSIFSQHTQKNKQYMKWDAVLDFEKKWTRDYYLIYKQIEKDFDYIKSDNNLFYNHIILNIKYFSYKRSLLEDNIINSTLSFFRLIKFKQKAKANAKIFLIRWLLNNKFITRNYIKYT